MLIYFYEDRNIDIIGLGVLSLQAGRVMGINGNQQQDQKCCNWYFVMFGGLVCAVRNEVIFSWWEERSGTRSVG